MDEECIGVDMYNLTLTGGVSMTLTGAASDAHHVPCVIAFDRAAYNQGKDAKFDFSVTEDEIQPTITARGVGGVLDSNMEVRRLTPLEAERLQNFPDGWTDIGDWTDTKGKKHKGGADAPRYKALGNSIALPYWRWLCKRISAQYERDATMGSLFDGIGGFDICWALVNGEENVRWSSEIEEFPIAVVKKHFGDEDTGEEGDFSEAIKKLNRRRNPEPAETKQPVVFEPGVTSRDSKHVWEDGVAPTIRSNPGDNAPSIVNDPDAPYTLQIRSGKAGGG